MPYQIIRKNQRCYEVINSITGRVHAKCTSKKKAQGQIRILENLEAGAIPTRLAVMPRHNALLSHDDDMPQGGAILDTAVGIIKSVADRLSLKKREAGKLPPKSRNLLAKVGGEPITKMVLVRTPIESYINRTLGLVSLGSWQSAVQKSGYDKLFHLSAFINDKYVLHKIEVTTLAQENPIKPESETMDVNLLGKSITIQQLIDTTRNAMGDQKFTDYDPIRNNCQVFIDAMLSANGLNNPELKKFVLQDAIKIFEQTPSLTGKFAQFVTDIGARVNRLVEGEGQRGGAGGAVESGRKGIWIIALKEWNAKNKSWCVPRKGTREYEQVKKIMEKISAMRVEMKGDFPPPLE